MNREHLMNKSWQFMFNYDSIYYLLVESPNSCVQDRRRWIKASIIFIWKNILFNILMLFIETWCDFNIKIKTSFVKVQRIKKGLMSFLFKCIHCLCCFSTLQQISIFLSSMSGIFRVFNYIVEYHCCWLSRLIQIFLERFPWLDQFGLIAMINIAVKFIELLSTTFPSVEHNVGANTSHGSQSVLQV